MDTNNKNTSNELSQLLHHATSLNLSAYKELSDKLLNQLTGPDLGEVYLSRAQIKLLTADHTIAQDLQQADKLLPEGSKNKPLSENITLNSPNAFFVFSEKENSLQQFLKALEQSDPIILKLLDDNTQDLRLQIESEIRYYMGDLQKAADIAFRLSQKYDQSGSYDRAMTAKHTLLKCNLALGNTKEISLIIEWMIKRTKAAYNSLNNPIYQLSRSWFNITTGWSGDTQRYYVTPDFQTYPALEDRAEAMQKGIAKLDQTETPFVQYAKTTQPQTCTMRQLYADIYKMLLAYKYYDPKSALELFDPIYQTITDNKLTMPFAEYGYQIIPLLQHAAEQNTGQYSHQWLEHLIGACDEYEEHLRKLREE